jgi:hypothetical protein
MSFSHHHLKMGGEGTINIKSALKNLTAEILNYTSLKVFCKKKKALISSQLS